MEKKSVEISEIVKNLSVTLQNHVGVTCRRCRELSLKSLIAILVTCRLAVTLLPHGMSRAVYLHTVGDSEPCKWAIQEQNWCSQSPECKSSRSCINSMLTRTFATRFPAKRSVIGMLPVGKPHIYYYSYANTS
jgi:hypothetical protein